MKRGKIQYMSAWHTPQCILSHMKRTLPLYLDKRYQPENKYGIRKIKISFWMALAHIKFLLLLRKFIKKRSPIETIYIYPRSIIFDFFIQERKKFSDLKKF